MKLIPIKVGYAAALAFAILWIFCSMAAWLMPAMMLSVTGSMMHSDWSQMGLHISFGSVLTGLIAWSGVAGLSGWLITATYNKLL